MKKYIKHTPSDFIVNEHINLYIQRSGEFLLFKLKKSNLSTLQVVRFLSNYFRIKPSLIGFAGLKDKYAITIQYITIPSYVNVPDKLCFQKNNRWEKVNNIIFGKMPAFCIEKVGFTDKPISLGDNTGNNFEIRIYNIDKNQRQRFYENLEIIKKFGIANYFGEQRFGSSNQDNNFVFKLLLENKIEKALKLYFSIKTDTKNWGNWEKFYKDIKGKVEQYELDLILGLKRGLSFEKAIRILPKNIRLMFNFSYQSMLWNEYLSEYIKQKYPYKKVPFINKQKLNFYLYVDDLHYLRNLYIPYTNKDFPTDDKILDKIIKKTLKHHKISADMFEKEIIGIKILTDGIRKAIVFPENIKITAKTKSYITIEFFIPAGSYATTVLRSIIF